MATGQAPAAAAKSLPDWICEAGHELRQPMQVLSVCTGALDYQLHDPAPRATLDTLRQATAELERLLDLLTGLAALAGARLQVSPVDVDLRLPLDRVNGRLRRELGGLPVCLMIDDTDPPVVKTDPVLLERLLWHLCRALLPHNGAHELRMAWGLPAGGDNRARLTLQPKLSPAPALVQVRLFSEPEIRPDDRHDDRLGLLLVRGLADLLGIGLTLQSHDAESVFAVLVLPMARPGR